ncbi:beta-N-acetylhexosaminidase [Arundinibacter roseus]|uniref:beta-N-acetylhexosaminidase n=1 Tax=Arundinibacter roseus TaxID=2070510 RepID=A0A4R4KIT7_9BACT|nr:family 20 glycosylhydrolase [Arundinibacter roseus]TDB68154.1 beta-N-acetylhexosaminidase [Arundinibacter roseus]
MKKLFLLFLILGANYPTFAQHNLIPAPFSYESTSAFFMLDAQTKVDVVDENADAKKIADFFVRTFLMGDQAMQFRKVATPSQDNRVIYFQLNKTEQSELGAEGYAIEVSDHAVRLSANRPAGLFYAVQSFRQMLGASYENKEMKMPMVTIQGCKIIDKPRFGWRGLMLDVSRHFFTKEEVKAYIDLMAQYKFNTLHWHLTDDNGWRLEIKSLPKLTEIGAWRVERRGHFNDREDPKEGEPATYGGFYTHEDVREIVQFAAERHVTILPEIDIPGHSMAALAAYPDLSTLKDPKTKVNPGTAFSEWFADGSFKMNIENTLDPSNEKVYDFLDKVFTEVAALFPHPYIHVGGDEAYHGFWEADANCQALMKKKGLKNGHELQGYFIGRVGEILKKKGKKMIGWDEILEGATNKDAAIMSWQGMKQGIEAAKGGQYVVMTPKMFTYLDYIQGDPSLETPIYAALSLKKAYSFDPLPEGVDPKFILGGQGNLWTEQIPTLRHAYYMTYPRAFALIESMWSPADKKNYEDFLRRTEAHFARFDAAERSISKAIYDVIVETNMQNDDLICTLSCDVPGVDIFVTDDNTFPDKFSPKYSGPFVVPTGPVTLKIVTYRNGQPLGRMLSLPRAELIKRAK